MAIGMKALMTTLTISSVVAAMITRSS